jgi:hypothetical protein
VANQFPLSGGGFTDNKVFQTCMGGSEGKNAVGEGPCNPNTGVCQNATTQGTTGPVACPSNNAGSGLNCEFSDGACFKKGNRAVTTDGVTRQEHMPVTGCLQNLFQNGDLDFDGTDYQANTWPNGSPNHPTSFRYIGPFDRSGHLYPQIQFEIERRGLGDPLQYVTPAPHGAAAGLEFYSVLVTQQQQKLDRRVPRGACVWNFGNVLPGVTKRTFGKGRAVRRAQCRAVCGTSTSPVMTNPATTGNCARSASNHRRWRPARSDELTPGLPARDRAGRPGPAPRP